MVLGEKRGYLELGLMQNRCVNASIVGGNDGLGNGQANSVASGSGISGGIGAVEPLKQDVRISLRQRKAGSVDYRQLQLPGMLLQGQLDTAAFRGILQRIIQQNADELPVGELNSKFERFRERFPSVRQESTA